MKDALKEVNREHLRGVCRKYGISVLVETGIAPSRAEMVEWAVKTYKEKEDAVDFVQFEGTKMERVVKRHLAVLNE
tara:strand:- start:89 stop:316 length:228 start_codon:yes stop_codon:yes gene_type:complete